MFNIYKIYLEYTTNKLRPHEPGKIWLPTNINPQEKNDSSVLEYIHHSLSTCTALPKRPTSFLINNGQLSLASTPVQCKLTGNDHPQCDPFLSPWGLSLNTCK